MLIELVRMCEQTIEDLYRERGHGSTALTVRQTTLLGVLSEHPQVSQTDLVRLTGIDRSTLAEMVRRMLERGLITRQRTQEDMRANAVAITTSGTLALRKCRTIAAQVETDMLAHLNAQDQQRFFRVLKSVATSSAPEPASRKKRRLNGNYRYA